MITPEFHQLFATDKEIFDLIMASPKRMSEGVVLELLADRRIFCSPNAGREELASFLAGVPHDFQDLASLIIRGEHGRRAERTTSIELQTELTGDELKAAIAAYQKDTNATEKVSLPPTTVGRIKLNVEYEEIDYSRTRLIQRQRREADIDFNIRGGRTLIRLPATDKARQIVSDLKSRIESSRKERIQQSEISASHMTSALERTDFFMKLSHGIAGFTFDQAVDAKVARFPREDADDLDADEERNAEESAISVINSISIRGQNVILAPEYHSLLRNEFFLTSLTWQATQTAAPRDQVQFEAAFEDGPEGTNFRYSVRHRERRDEKLLATFRAVPENRRPGLFQLIEDAARQAMGAALPGRSAADVPKSGDAK